MRLNMRNRPPYYFQNTVKKAVAEDFCSKPQIFLYHPVVLQQICGIITEKQLLYRMMSNGLPLMQ